MNPDSKQKVLLALYTEYQKDLPNFDKITPTLLGLDQSIFNTALKKLQDEELIRDVHLIWGEENQSVPMGVVLMVCRLTRRGIDYVENNFDIQSGLPGREKVRILSSKFTDLGLEELNELAVRVLTDLS